MLLQQSLILVCLLFPYLSLAGYNITVIPYLTDVLESGRPFLCRIRKTSLADVTVVDVLLFNTVRQNSSILSKARWIDQENERNFLSVSPFVPVSDRYVIRLLNSFTQQFLQDSDQDFFIGPYEPPFDDDANNPPLSTLTHSPSTLSSPASATTPTSERGLPPKGLNRSVLIGSVTGAIMGFVLASIIAIIAFCRCEQRRYRARLHGRPFPFVQSTPPASIRSVPFHRSSTPISRSSLQTHATGQTHNTLFPNHPPRSLQRSGFNTERTTGSSLISDPRMETHQLGAPSSHELLSSAGSSAYTESLTIDEHLSLLREKIRELEEQRLHQDLNHRTSRPLSMASSEVLPRYPSEPLEGGVVYAA